MMTSGTFWQNLVCCLIWTEQKGTYLTQQSKKGTQLQFLVVEIETWIEPSPGSCCQWGCWPILCHDGCMLVSCARVCTPTHEPHQARFELVVATSAVDNLIRITQIRIFTMCTHPLDMNYIQVNLGTSNRLGSVLHFPATLASIMKNVVSCTLQT